MKTQKQWSYQEITNNTENKIKRLMEIAIEDSLIPHDFSMWQSIHTAWGVYWGWYTLTNGWQKEGDNERLENLTKIENYKSHGN